MNKIWQIVDQLEQSKAFIAKDKPSFYRMALLLLDNTAEVLMYRKLLDEFIYDDWYYKLFENAKAVMPKDAYDEYVKVVKFKLIEPRSRKKVMLKFFDEKTKFFSEDRSYIEPEIARILRACHKYRNEAYHRDTIRKESIRPVVFLLYEIVCDLLVKLPPRSTTMSSEEDWTEYFSRYELSHERTFFIGEKDLALISSKLKSGFIIEFKELKIELMNHMNNRLEGFIDNIEFLRTDGWRISSQDETLKRIQLIRSELRDTLHNFEEVLKEFRPKYTMGHYEKWVGQVEALAECSDKLELFNMFSSIEEDFEPIEAQVQESAYELDSHIDSSYDIASGK